MRNIVLTLDIAHPPLSSTEADAALFAGLRKVELSASLRILKVIHGYGSSGRGGTLREETRAWGYRNRKRMQEILAGEDCTPFNPTAQAIARECNLFISGDLGEGNEGMTIFWVK